MDLRRTIYLLDKCASDPGPFKGAIPPLRSDVYLKFKGIHDKLQKKSPGKSSEREASKKNSWAGIKMVGKRLHTIDV